MTQWKDIGRGLGKSAAGMHRAAGAVIERLEQRTLLADTPALEWSSYVGGSSQDVGTAIAIDGSGNAWVTGVTTSPDFASGGFDTSYNGGGDAFVAKINADGTLAWSSYLGGSADDGGMGIAIDGNGNAWVAGNTRSTDFASGGFDTTYNGGADAFVAKINADGTLAWVSYLGGTSYDEGSGIAIDGGDNVWVTGRTSSTDFPSNGFGTNLYGTSDAFVAKISTDGTLLWSSYLGGAAYEEDCSIAVDGSGNAWVTGVSNPGGTTMLNTFSAKINADGTLAWFIGWGGLDIATDSSGDARLWWVGAIKINADGTLAWQTTLASASRSPGGGIALDGSDNAWVTGDTGSPGWTRGGFDNSYDGGYDAYVAKIDADGKLVWSSYLGGSGYDKGYAIAIDGNGDAWVTGLTDSLDFASGGFDTSYNGGVRDAFVAKIGKLHHAPLAYDQSLTTNQGIPIQARAIAADEDQDTLTYSEVIPPAHGTLSFRTDGTFTYTPADNYFGDDSFTWKANDGKLDSNVATVRIDIAHDARTSLSPSSILENQPPGTVVGALTTTGDDADHPSTYSLVSGFGDANNASFSIAGNQLLSAVSFDYETRTRYSIHVRTTDSFGLSFEQSFTVTVMNVNEAPTDVALVNSLVVENQPSGTVVGPLASTDPDVGDSFTYHLVSGTGDDDNASFTISGGQLFTAASFSLADRSTYSVRIRTTDAGGLSFAKALTIHVVSIALSNAMVPENQPYNTLIGTLSCSNADAFTALTYTLVPGTGDDDNGNFAIAGDQLLTAGPLNYEGKNSCSVRIRSSNLGVVIYEAIYPITITNENESPTNVLLSGSGVPEGQPIGTKVGRLSATDSDGEDTFTYALVNGFGDDDNASFRIIGNRMVTATTFNYIPGREYAVRVRATDAGGLSVEKELGIPILAVFEFGRVDGRSNKNLSIADGDGDVVTFKLSGGGMGSFWGNQVGLIDTTATSTLSITVKKGKYGDGLYHLGDITSDGLLKSISAKSVVESGEVLLNSLGRSAGKAAASLTFRQISDANICIQGLPVASIAVSGDVSNSRIVTTGSIKKMTVATLLDSDILVGVAADCAEHFATADDFANLSAKLETLKVTGRKLPSKTSHPAYVANSHISAPTVGTITLVNLPAASDPLLHVLTDAGALTVTQSKLTSTPMFAPGTWKKPGQRPSIWQTLL